MSYEKRGEAGSGGITGRADISGRVSGTQSGAAVSDPNGGPGEGLAKLERDEETVAREIAVITEEILFYKRQAGGAIIEIGKRLNEAKEMLPHGEWLPWLTEKVDFSERSAQNFMRLAREYGKSAEIADLGATKALALLALPVSERDDFTEEKHLVDGVEKTVAEMSGKELREAIKARKEAEERAAQADTDAKAAREEAERARTAAKAAEDSRAKMEADMKLVNERLEGLNDEGAEKARLLRELEERPVEVAVQEPDPEVLEAAVAEARKEAEAKLTAAQAALDKAREEQRQKVEEAKKLKEQLAAATKQTEEAVKEAETARKAAAVSGSEDLTTFKVLFAAAQKNINDMAELLQKVERNQKDQGVGLRKALGALAEAVRKVAESET